MTAQVLCGPMASGKTRHRRIIANLVGCSRICDGLELHELDKCKTLAADVLVITNADSRQVRRALPNAKVHHIADFAGKVEGVDEAELGKVEICDLAELTRRQRSPRKPYTREAA